MGAFKWPNQESWRWLMFAFREMQALEMLKLSTLRGMMQMQVCPSLFFSGNVCWFVAGASADYTGRCGDLQRCFWWKPLGWGMEALGWPSGWLYLVCARVGTWGLRWIYKYKQYIIQYRMYIYIHAYLYQTICEFTIHSDFSFRDFTDLDIRFFLCSPVFVLPIGPETFAAMPSWCVLSMCAACQAAISDRIEWLKMERHANHQSICLLLHVHTWKKYREETGSGGTPVNVTSRYCMWRDSESKRGYWHTEPVNVFSYS